MLQNIGDKLKSNRWIAGVILGGLALLFAVWGAYGVVNISFGTANYGLKVNGERITTDTLNRAWQQRLSQYSQALNGNELGDAQKAILQQQLIEEYIRDTVLRQRAEDSGLRASEAQVLAAYQSETAFQVDGKFNAAAARTMLAQAGMTPETFEANQRQDLAVGQLTEGVQLSDFLTPAELQRIYALENETREVRFALLPADKYAASVKIDDARIKSWYDAHQGDYMSPESVHLKYAELTLDGIASQISVTPEGLQAYYDKNKDKYSDAEKRHAHHILITVADPKDAKADAAAQAKAQQVLADAKSGKDFAELAKKYSADPGTASQGGDLGWAEKSAYVGAFADALFGMQAGQIIGPVKTQYGYHIIKLDEVRPAHVKTLDEARSEIETAYRRDQATQLFGDREEQLQQKLENGGNLDLDALAKEFDLQTGEVAEFTRSNGGAPLGSKPDLIQAVFGDTSGGKLGGPVALSDDQLVVYKVLEHHAPAPQSIASVHDEIVAAIRKSDSTAAAKAAADDTLKQLQAGTSFDALSKTLGVTVAPAMFYGRSDPQLPVQVREAAFALPTPKDKPQYKALALDDGGAVVVAVSAVKAGTAGANAKNDEQLETAYLKRNRQDDLVAYLQALQQAATVKRNPDLFQ